jgi:serine/threonine-protein kinase
MAPEQVMSTSIDRRTDLFAAGIMLYTLTAGRHPFKHHNDAGVLHAITSENPAPRPSSFVPDYPAALEAVVMKALEKDMAKRFATAEEMRQALELAVPAAAAAGDAAVGKYIAELLADNINARREAVRRTLLRADTHDPTPGSSPLALGAQSVGSLDAVAVDRRATGSGAAVSVIGQGVPRRLDSKLPLARSRKRYQAAFAASVAIALAAVFVAMRGLTPFGASPRAASSPVVAAPESAEPTKAAPQPVEPPEPARGSERDAVPAVDAGAASEPRPSAPNSAKPATVQRAAAKPKRDPKPAPAGDLIAPDYAR